MLTVEFVLSLMVIKLEDLGAFGNRKRVKLLRREPKDINPLLTLAILLT